MTINKIVPFFCIILGVGFAVSSCKKYPDNPPYFQEIDSLKTPPNRKVLVIGVDGLASAAVQSIAPAKLTAILQKSKYSWDAISDKPTNSATVWKTLTSGVQSSKHLILDSSFNQTQSGDNEHQVVKKYPSLFNLLLSSTKPELTTSFIGRWNAIATAAVPDAGSSLVLGSDQLVKDSLVSRLKKDKPADITFVQFSDPANAGVADGFTATAPGYKAAIEKLADNLSEIIDALKARPNYNKSEEWMIVITGTNGGVDHSYSNGTVPEREVPLIYYNERFKPLEFSGQGLYSSVQMGVGADKVNSTRGYVDNAPEFNFAATGEYTVQFKYNSSNKTQYPVFFSKIENGLGSPGWAIFTNNSGNWNLQLGGLRYQSGTGDIHDGQWHTVTFVLYDSASSRWVKRFTDGVRLDEGATSRVQLNRTSISPAPLRVGFGGDPSQGSVLCRFADITFFNTALSDATIIGNLCNTNILNTHPNKNNIYAYWPCNDGFQNQFANAVNPNKPFTIINNYSWTAPAVVPCSISGGTSPKPNTVQTKLQIPDIARQLFYWVGVSVPNSWGIDGSLWLSKYESEFLIQQ